MKRRIILTLLFLVAFGVVSVTPSALFLDDLEDVTITSPAEGEHLLYNSSSANWTNQEVATVSMLYHPHNQNINTTATQITALAFNSGQGNTELYPDDHDDLVKLYTTIGLKDLTSGEVNQLENIGTESISATEWSYLADLDQSVDKQENVEFDGLTINEDSAIESAIHIKPASTQDARVYWYANSDANYWYFTLTESSQNLFKMAFYDGSSTLQAWQSQKNVGFPSNWVGSGFAGQTNPTYGTQVPNSISNDGKCMANQQATYSDNRSKWFIGSLPSAKLRILCELIEFRMYYKVNHTYDNDGNLIFDTEPYTEQVLLGVDAQKLYYDILATFSYPLNEKIAKSIVLKPDNENKQFWGVDQDVILMLKIQNIENMLIELL